MEKDDKRIEDLVNKLMKADALEQPSFDFTDKVMDQVEALSDSSVTTYKPLIPKSVFYAIATGFLILVGYVLFNGSSSSESLTEKYKLVQDYQNILQDISFDFSSTLMYSILFLAIMVSVQIPLLKHYVNNRLSF